MATPAQIRANRANAQRSTGPKTAAGRQKSAQNARKHGLTSQADPEKLAALAAELEVDGCSQAEAAALARWELQITDIMAESSRQNSALVTALNTASAKVGKDSDGRLARLDKLLRQSRLLDRYYAEATAGRRNSLRAINQRTDEEAP